jgi:HEAT repeat protein
MHTLTAIANFMLPVLALTLVVLWAGLSAYLVVAGRRARHHASVVSRTIAELRRIEASGAMPELQVRELAQLAARVERVTILRLATALPDRSPASEIFARSATTHHTLDWFVQQASASRSPRANWRRISALRLLAQQGYSGIVPLLGQAVADPDSEIVGAALAILGRTPDMKAAEILVNALKAGQYAPSRVATYLDQFPLPLTALLRPLLQHSEPNVRYWAVTLLAKYHDTPGLDVELRALTADAMPLVRRAAIASLARVSIAAAVDAARRMLNDPVWYVRAHAARALAEAQDPDLADAVAPLLADREWWVRTAAKDALQRMGPEVWSALVPYLDHGDPFARNGAAEVLQNIGILDSLIVLEAATAKPSPTKIEMLKKIASAGGTRMTEALLDRVDQHTRPRVRALLASLGLETAGASL